MSDLLVPVLLVEGGLLLLGLVVLLGHMLYLTVRGRFVAPRLAIAEDVAVRGLAVSDPHEAAAAIRRLPSAEALTLLVRLADAVTGRAGRTVTSMTRISGLLGRVERQVSSPWWWRRLRAVRLLTRLGGGGDVVPARLDDRSPDVRAQAASWVARHGDGQAVADVVDHLVDADRLARFAAADAAVRLGPSAAPELAAVIARTEGPALVPALVVAAALRDAPVLAGPVRRCLRAPEPEVRAAAIRALSRLGGAGEAEAFETALGDEDPQVRAAAVQACARAELWRVSPRLGVLLRDPSWDVRRAAGLALRRLGGPGKLVLRRSLADDDRFAADMARLVLDEERIA